MTTTSERQDLVHHATLCDSAKRYEEMVDVIDDIITSLPKNHHLTSEERKLLALAYKNELAPKRRSYKSLHKVVASRDLVLEKKRIAIEYRRLIGGEIVNLCKHLIELLDTKLMPGVNEPESDIFYHKLKGDYYRYLMEVEEDEVKVDEYTAIVKECYEGATDYSDRDLAATHPLRIGLAMNYSVFMYETLGETDRGFDHAKRYYDNALDELEQVRDVDEVRYNECVGLLRLMHENIKAWSKGRNVQLQPTDAGGTIPTENTLRDF